MLERLRRAVKQERMDAETKKKDGENVYIRALAWDSKRRIFRGRARMCLLSSGAGSVDSRGSCSRRRSENLREALKLETSRRLCRPLAPRPTPCIADDATTHVQRPVARADRTGGSLGERATGSSTDFANSRCVDMTNVKH